MSAVLLSTDKVLVCYCNYAGNKYLFAQILTIAGTTITASTPVSVVQIWSHVPNVVRLSENKTLLYYTIKPTSYLRMTVLTISGTTITASTSMTVMNSKVIYLNAMQLDGNRTVLQYLAYVSPTLKQLRALVVTG